MTFSSLLGTFSLKFSIWDMNMVTAPGYRQKSRSIQDLYILSELLDENGSFLVDKDGEVLARESEELWAPN